MTLRRLAATALPLVLTLLSAWPSNATPIQRPVAIVVLVDGVSFEQLMAVPEIRALASHGGAGLMSPRTVPDDKGPGHYLTLGTGARSGSPISKVPVRLGVAGGGIDMQTFVRANQGRSTPGLLASELERHLLFPAACLFALGREVAPQPPAQDEGLVRNLPAALFASDRRGAVFVGGVVSTVPALPHVVRLPSCPLVVFALGPDSALDGRAAFQVVAHLNASRVLVLIAGPAPSAWMDRAGDELTPIVMAEGDPLTLFSSAGAVRTLTSDTTRRTGVVSNEDVAPTILHFFHIPVPAEMNGSPIRVVDAPPPFALHRKHLEARRMTVPIQAGAGIAVTLMGFLALGAVTWRRRLPTAVRRGTLVLPLAIPTLAGALLGAASLPNLTYATVIPTVVLGALAGALLGLATLKRGPLVPAAATAAAVLVFFLVEAIRGWPDTMFTFLGGTALDGARFYGLPNNDIGLLAGCGLWIAASLAPYAGFALLVALALFAGFPDLGANLGGALTLFAAAGLWLMLRTHPKFRAKEIAFTAAVVAVGMAVVLGANRYITSSPTHGTRFVENAPRQGLGGIAHTVSERFGTGVRLLLHTPLAFIPVLALPILLWLALRPPVGVRPSFDRHPSWRTAMVVLVLAGIVAFVANDTGAAAAGLAFGMALAGLLYLPLAESATSTARVGDAEPSLKPQPVGADGTT